MTTLNQKLTVSIVRRWSIRILNMREKRTLGVKVGEGICSKGHIFMVLKIMCAASEQAL